MIYMKFKNLEQFENLVQAVSVRAGGMSTEPYAALNLGYHTGDNPDNVLLNREILCNKLRIPLDCLVCAKQTHGRNVAVIEKGDWGKGSEDYESAVDDTDGMVTNAPNIFLMVLVADCPGIVFFDPKKKAVGIAHAGWRPTLAKISRNVIDKMQKTYKSKSQDILCGISSSIGPCCYEVKEGVAREFGELPLPIIEQRDGKFFLNLWEANRRQLIEAGIREENIEVAGLCTSCRNELFYSLRKEGKTGRYGVLIGMRK
jgi:polyphenol oxidase